MFESEEFDETYVEPDQPHRPQLVDGKRYTGKITDVEVLKDQSTWNNEIHAFDPAILHDDLKYTVDVGKEVMPPLTFKVKKSNYETSNLYKLAREFGFLPKDISKEGITGSRLVGKSCSLVIKHSNPSKKNGGIFDNVDISSVRAIDTGNTIDDDANNAKLV